MTTIITGTGLGLFNTSQNLLGASGDPLIGRPWQSDAVYINGTTGNLVVRAQDEFLVSTGLDAALFRAYNSQGKFNDDNQDNWWLNLSQLSNQIGSPNGPSAKITKIFGDGAEVDYVYTNGAYVSTAKAVTLSADRPNRG